MFTPDKNLSMKIMTSSEAPLIENNLKSISCNLMAKNNYFTY